MVDFRPLVVGCSLIFVASVAPAAGPDGGPSGAVVKGSVPDEIFADDFELGNASRWSDSLGLVRTVTLAVFDDDLSCSVASSTTSGLRDQTCLTIEGLPGSLFVDCDAATSTWYENADCTVMSSACGPDSCCPAILSPMDFASFVWSCD